MRTLTLTIDGARIHDIASFYDEINRLFMPNESWQLGPSLDALNDLFYGGFGAMLGYDRLVLNWADFERSRTALGFEATRRHIQRKLEQPSGFDIPRIERELAALERGEGPTYFDQILEVIGEHPSIELRPA